MCHQTRVVAAPRSLRAACPAAAVSRARRTLASLLLLAARTDRSGLFIFHALRARVESARRAFDSSRLVHERVPACTRSPHLIHSRIPP
ncbi:methyltransferase [Burkholderia pseudomallei]|nr:hypothetical protein BMASAVP1_A3412 [Burkholderia mallei SAVP1]ARK51543.1 methyltransferase [Burkholderia pseudomallei]ARK55474.1 methyltransferase [Burkholderia pseudomallei]ARK65307.1 methyltransferase [Burkholderia pseudomallei]ARK69037.1 methyltransferase [Burkholderia pseudomallei]